MTSRIPFRFHRISSFFLLTVLLSCGGGGGGGGSGGGVAAFVAPPSTCIGTLPNPGPDSISDPLYADQWHLKNTGQAGGTPGEDINVEPVWANYKGDGLRIAVVDDGLEIAHEDLADNVVDGCSYDYIDRDANPDSGDYSHGTSVAGLAAARDLNDLGVRGAAPHAYLVGYNVLQNLTTQNEADAMIRYISSVAIFSNSWGAPDYTGFLYPSNATWRNAVETGLAAGRGGLGAIYTWAAGNGDTGACPSVGCVDNSNYDGQANSRGVIAVGAVNDQGVKSSYSERGANLWVSAPGGEFCDTHAITTTDRSGSAGFNDNGNNIEFGNVDYPDGNYTKCFNGTSAATPLVSGTIALMLQANPNLGWRDVRLILAQTARKNDPADSDWTTNGAGYNINHNYGFGVVDAQAAVTAAQTWTNVGPEVTFATALSSPNLAIPDCPTQSCNPGTTTGVSNTITVNGSGINSIEFVEITFSANDHTYFGDLQVTLTHVDTGTQSILAERHICLDSQQNIVQCTPSYNRWVFGSARHLGEAADGNWTLTVKDLAGGDKGHFKSWMLKFYGS
jgi:kexin